MHEVKKKYSENEYLMGQWLGFGNWGGWTEQHVHGGRIFLISCFFLLFFFGFWFTACRVMGQAQCEVRFPEASQESIRPGTVCSFLFFSPLD